MLIVVAQRRNDFGRCMRLLTNSDGDSRAKRVGAVAVNELLPFAVAVDCQQLARGYRTRLAGLPLRERVHQPGVRYPVKIEDQKPLRDIDAADGLHVRELDETQASATVLAAQHRIELSIRRNLDVAEVVMPGEVLEGDECLRCRLRDSQVAEQEAEEHQR